MNERIRELELQSYVDVKSTMIDPSNNCPIQVTGKEFSRDKFAELIAKECLKLCKEVESDLAGIYEDAERDATQIGARFCYEAILGEFGVEE
jgi:hypothetical protein